MKKGGILGCFAWWNETNQFRAWILKCSNNMICLALAQRGPFLQRYKKLSLNRAQAQFYGFFVTALTRCQLSVFPTVTCKVCMSVAVFKCGNKEVAAAAYFCGDFVILKRVKIAKNNDRSSSKKKMCMTHNEIGILKTEKWWWSLHLIDRHGNDD